MTSLSRRELKRFAALSRKKYRREYRQCILEGVRLCSEALRSDWHLHTLFVTQEFYTQNQDALPIQLSRDRGVEIRLISQSDFRKITDTKSGPGVALLAHLPEPRSFTPAPAHMPDILLLDAIKDPGNLGTLFRSADWFGVRHIVLGTGTVEWSNPKVLRSSMGAVFRTPLYGEQTLDTLVNVLKQSDYHIIAADLDGTPLPELTALNIPEPLALILGNEAHGISPAISAQVDATFTIPGEGSADSLNVAMAGAVFLYELYRIRNP